MQDDEIDDLFRSKLDGFEMKPSANVWHGVTAELQPLKNKGVLVSFLSIAASILVLITAGILFIPQKGGVIIKHSDSTRATKTHSADSLVAKANNNPAKNALIVTTIGNNALIPINKVGSNNKAGTTKVIQGENIVVTEKKETAVRPVEQSEIASVTLKTNSKDVVLPGNETKRVPKQPIEETTMGFATKPLLVADQMPAQNEPEVGPELKPKHKIHTLGDLINVVVAKVDKRKDKVIEFTTRDDEDEATVTGVNLGIIKFKKEK